MRISGGRSMASSLRLSRIRGWSTLFSTSWAIRGSLRYSDPQDFSSPIRQLEPVIDAAADDPDDLFVHLQHPNFLLLRQREFLVDKEAGQLFLFPHPQRIEVVALTPGPQEEGKI